MAQLMPLPLTVSCFSKIKIGFTFLVLAHPGSSGQRAVKRMCSVVSVEKQIYFVIVFFRQNDEFEGQCQPVVIQHMDIAQPLSTLRRLLEAQLNISLQDYEFWLQDSVKVLYRVFIRNLYVDYDSVPFFHNIFC